MKNKEEVKPELVNAARIALSRPGEDEFWQEVEDRMDIRDKANSELVTPRKK